MKWFVAGSPSSDSRWVASSLLGAATIVPVGQPPAESDCSRASGNAAQNRAA